MHKTKLTKLLCLVLSLMMILGAAPLTASAATASDLEAELEKLPNEEQMLYLSDELQELINSAKGQALNALENDPGDITNAYNTLARANIAVKTTPIECDCGSDAYRFAVEWGIPCNFTAGSHTFVNNVCTVCGTCDHNYFHNKCTRCGAYHPDFVVDENDGLVEYVGSGGDVIIPDGIKAIGHDAFSGWDFFHVGELNSVTIPASVESIGKDAFYNDTVLSSIYFLEGSKLTTIGEKAFYKCGIDADNRFHIYLPASVTSNVIADSYGGCFNNVGIAYIHLDWDSSTEIVDVYNLKRITSHKNYVTVPTGTLDLYKATNWGTTKGSLTEHTHSFTGAYFDLGDGTHCQLCECCLYGGATAHTYTNGVCACGAVEPPKHTHTFENGVCTDCEYKCTHNFENHVCTVCGMADKITNGELFELVGEQKFISSTGIVFSTTINNAGNYNLNFNESALTMADVSDKDVEVTSYGYKFTSSGYSGVIGDYIDNYFEFYFDGTGFTKLVCSNLVKAERNDTYLPYHPVTEVSVKAATCSKDGVKTAYWVCTDAGCGKMFTDNTCATEITAAELENYIIPATGHSFADTWSNDAAGHWYACTATNCDITSYATCGLAGAAYAAHTFEDGVCTVCDYACTHTTYENGKCTVCGMQKPCDHENTIVIDGIEANCVHGGYTGNLYCSDCETILEYGTETGIDPDNHDLVEGKTVAPTCAKEGYTEYSCSRCTYTTKLDFTDPTGEHVDTNGDFKCDVCSLRLTEAETEAKNRAKAEVNALADDASSSKVKAIVADAVYYINYANSQAVIDILVDEAKTNVAAQKAAEALEKAKTDAKATVNALAGVGASDEVKAIVAKAVEDIEAATSESAVSSVVSDAKLRVSAQKNLENVIATKKAELSTALAVAITDEAKEILTKALADLENVTNLTDAYGIPANAIGTARGKDSQYTGALTAYKNAFINNLTGNPVAAADGYLDYIIQALENTTSLAGLAELFNAEMPKIDFYNIKAGAETRYADSLAYNGLTAETKALIAEAVEKILASETPEEIKAVCNEYDIRIELASLKDKNTYDILALATENDSDEMTAIIKKGLADIKSAETLEAVSDAYVTAYNAIAEQRQIEAEALAEAKEEAAKVVAALASDGDSDEVTAIIEKALADIEAAEDIAAVEVIAAAAETDVAEQIAKEEAAKALAEAKQAAKDEIDAAAGDDDSAKVLAAVEEAKAAIDAAQTIEEVEAAKTAGLENIVKITSKCPYCGSENHNTSFDRWYCFFARIILLVIRGVKVVKNLFKGA